ncbi:hypothetical protein, partial [Escherichia coli]|uniref:hypothetical protein n=1 Tax=Escherichia coli TaxID=562 RepID=UPI0019535460
GLGSSIALAMGSGDGAFKAARVFSVLANIVIGVSMLALVAVSCMEYPQVILKVVGGMLLRE